MRVRQKASRFHGSTGVLERGGLRLSPGAAQTWQTTTKEFGNACATSAFDRRPASPNQSYGAWAAMNGGRDVATSMVHRWGDDIFELGHVTAEPGL